MARSIAGDPSSNSSPAPFQTPSNGLPPLAPPSPFNYTNQPNLPAPVVPSAPTPAGLLHAFRRRWVLGTFLGGLAAAAVALAAWMLMPGGKHQVRAFVQLRPRNYDIFVKNPEDYTEYRERQKFLLKAPDLIANVVREPAVSSIESIRAAVRNGDDPAQLVAEQLRVKDATTDVLEVNMTGNALDDMKVLVEQVVKRYIEDATGFERKALEERIKKEERHAEALQLEIDGKNSAILLLAGNNGTAGGEDLAKQLALLQDLVNKTEAEFRTLGLVIDELEARRAREKSFLDGAEKIQPSPALVGKVVDLNPNVAKAKLALDKRKADHETTLRDAGGDADNAFVVQMKAELEKAQKAYDEARKAATAEAVETAREQEVGIKQRAVTDLTTEIEVKRHVREKVRFERDGLRKTINESANGGVNIIAMQKALQPQRETLEKLNAHLVQLRLEQRMEGRPTLRGEVEKVPYTNQNKKIMLSAAGGLVSFVGVALLVAFLEWRTRRVDGVDQVVNELGMRVIGTVPAFPNRSNVKAAVAAGGANWRFVLNESINSTRTMLLHTARTQSMQVVMVTSATQGEGKTSLASQLATSMATAGMRTLIVDCDLRNPSIQKLFELPLGPGVSEVLRQEVDVSDAVQATAVPNLWVIPAGHCSNATIAALAQGQMETLFNRLRGSFEFIIVDSCPVLPVADALLVGQHVDGVVFSVMQDVSQLPKVQTASAKLAQLNITLVGAVVNGIKQDVSSYGYNYVKQLPA
jgi:capsular exopolysaccharide synthesis family protein